MFIAIIANFMNNFVSETHVAVIQNLWAECKVGLIESLGGSKVTKPIFTVVHWVLLICMALELEWRLQ